MKVRNVNHPPNKAYNGDILAACKLTEETITDILKSGVYKRRNTHRVESNQQRYPIEETDQPADAPIKKKITLKDKPK